MKNKNIKNSKKNINGLQGNTFHTRKTTKGFSLVEILISITIILTISAVSISAFLNWRSAKKIEASAGTVLTVLKEARNMAINGKGNDSYGVYFGDTDRTALFKGTSYNSNNVVSTTYLPSGTVISTSTLGSSVYFLKFSGSTNGNGTIVVKDINNASNTRTINIEAIGSLSTK